MISGIIFAFAFFQGYGHTISERKVILVGVILTLVGVILPSTRVFRNKKSSLSVSLEARSKTVA